jgi:hypothetical protein
MTSTHASARLGAFIAATGLVVAIGAALVAGFDAAWSAAAGAVLAVANFYVWSWLVGRMLARQAYESRSAQGEGGPPLGFLLGVKAVLGLGAVAGLLAFGLVDPIAFAAGLGSLVVGLVAGGAWLATAVPSAEGEA